MEQIRPIYSWLTLLVVYIGLTYMSVPLGLNPKGWQLFAIFVPTILGIILKPLPMAPVCLISLVVACTTGVIDFRTEGLTGFQSPVVWLIVFVFFISRGFIQTRLGDRIAYAFVACLGRKPLGLGYGIVLTEFLIAPFIPSNTARAGGIIFPILKSINQALGSRVEDGTERKVGSFLIQVAFHGNLITSAMFITAMAGNPIIQTIAAKQGIEITWLLWAKAAFVPGVVSMIVVPLFLYWVYPPQAKELPEAVDMARGKLHDMGPVSKPEWIMIGIFGIMLSLWIAGDELFGINATHAALIGLCLMLVGRIISWNDVLNEHEAWSTFVWISIIIMMSNMLEKLGFVGWFSQAMAGYVVNMSWMKAFGILSCVYFYSHYFFASNAAHISAMYAGFLAVSLATGTPPYLAVLVLGFFSSLFSCTTHYGTSPAVILFGSGYVSFQAWWSYGFLISLLHIAIWFVIGGMWWKFLELW